jgi:hypothetical protein
MAPKLPGEDKYDLWDTGDRLDRHKAIRSSVREDTWNSTHSMPPSNAKYDPAKRKYDRKFEWEADPDDHWDTGKNVDPDEVYDEWHFNNGDWKSGVDRGNLKKDPLESLKKKYSVDNKKRNLGVITTERKVKSFGRRVRKMSKEFSIPILPLLVVGYLLFGGDDDEDTTKEVKDTSKPVKQVVEQVKTVANDAVEALKPVVEKAKTEFAKDNKEPKPASNGNQSGDPFDYKTDDLYGNTDSKY